MTDADVARIAAGLTEAQRSAVVGWMSLYADPNTVRSLRNRGLAERTTLTPLGLALRAYLTDHSSDPRNMVPVDGGEGA